MTGLVYLNIVAALLLVALVVTIVSLAIRNRREKRRLNSPPDDHLNPFSDRP